MMAGRRSLLITAGLAVALAVGATPASAQDAAPEAKPEKQKETQAAEEARIKAAAKVLQRSLDALRAKNFERWIACYSPDVVIRSPQMHINSRKELRAIYGYFFKTNVAHPEILDSGWTGERIYVRALETFGEGGPSVATYAEYEIENGLITAVYSQVE